MSALGEGAAAAAGVAALVTSVRWLRVAQREHYLPGSVSRFAWRWWTIVPLNSVLLLLALAGLGISFRYPVGAFATALVALVAPIGLGLRGRTSRLAWTRRLRTLAAAYLVLGAAAVAAGVAAGAPAPAAAAAALGAAIVLDAALAVLAPLESRLAGRHVERAAGKVARVKPRIVAITGSYGKTSTKGYVAHLLSGALEVVASPASYNNRAGLARTVNERLVPGTEVLVAEMGAYGPGEIAAMCRFLPPEIAVITAIGPVHLERFGSLDRTLAAKAEITGHARAIVLAVDDERLAGLADRLEREGRHVVRCSARDRAADVCVVFEEPGEPAGPGGGPASPADLGELACHLKGERAGGVEVTRAALPPALSNVACAVAVALELGLPASDIVPKLASLPVPANRLQSYRAEAGFEILDDTFNSNPAGAEMALGLLAALGAPGGRRVVVTPGMVELGGEQARENARFASRCATVATDVVVVARTNRRALLRGLADREPGAGHAGAAAGPAVVVVDNREDAVRWLRGRLGAGDAVLYENDLPDHFP